MSVGAAMRVFSFVFLATILAGCTSASDPDDAFSRAKLAAVGPMSSLSSPQLARDPMVGADGAALPLRRPLPAGRPRAGIFALPGLSGLSHGLAWRRSALGEE